MTMTDRMDLLRRKCSEIGQAAVARALNYSDSAISQALNGKYQGSLDTLLTKVEEIFGNSTVECPVIGVISLGRCSEIRKRPFAATNPVRGDLYQACQTCPHKGSAK